MALDGYADLALARLLAECGHLEELRAWADTGDGYAASELADLRVAALAD